MKKYVIYLICIILTSSLYLTADAKDIGYIKSVEMGVDSNGENNSETTYTPLTIDDEPQIQQPVGNYIDINPYYNNGLYNNSYYPYQNYNNYNYGYPYFAPGLPTVYTYSLTGIKYGPTGRALPLNRPYTPPPPPPMPPKPMPPNHHPDGNKPNFNNGGHPHR